VTNENDRLGAALAATIDPDKLLTVPECVDVFGLDEATWRKAVRERAIPFAQAAARQGTRIKASDARAFANAWHEKNKKAATTA
jgi:hypothetical protein